MRKMHKINKNTNATPKFLIVMILITLLTSFVDICIVSATPPIVMNPNANPDTIPADGITMSRLNVTVTVADAESFDPLESVTIDLSLIGGASSQTMAPIGDDVYSTTTPAPVGTAPGTYNLVVTATNIDGDSNTSVSIPLTVTAPLTPTPFIPGGSGGKGRETPTPTATPTSLPTASPQVTFTPPTAPPTVAPTTPTPTTPTPIPTATPPAAIPGFGILSAVIAVMSVFALSVVKRKRKK